MKRMIYIVPVLCAAFVAFSPIAESAGQTAKSGKEPETLRPTPKGKAESEAFNALSSIQDPVALLKATDSFMASYGSSQLVGEVMGMRTDSYLRQKMFPEALDELAKTLAFNDKFLADKIKEAPDKNSPLIRDLTNYRDGMRIQYFRRMTDAAQAFNQPELADFFGKEILKVLPNDFPTLLTVARVIAQNPDAKDKEKKDAQLAEAEYMGQLAVNYVVAYLNSPNSAEMKPEQKNEWFFRAHSLMGLIYNQRQQYPDAEKAFMVALGYKKDSGAYYNLGYAYYSEKKFDAAIDAAQRAMLLKGGMEAAAKDLLRVLYRETKRPLADIDKDVQAAGERIGKMTP